MNFLIIALVAQTTSVNCWDPCYPIYWDPCAVIINECYVTPQVKHTIYFDQNQIRSIKSISIIRPSGEIVHNVKVINGYIPEIKIIYDDLGRTVERKFFYDSKIFYKGGDYVRYYKRKSKIPTSEPNKPVEKAPLPPVDDSLKNEYQLFQDIGS